MTAQRTLPIKDPRYKRPLMDVAAARGILDVSEDEIVALVEEQGALVAFNIATPGAKARELRIMTLSVSEYLRDNPKGDPCYHSMMQPHYAASLAVDAIGHTKPFLTGMEVQRVLNCGSTHVINLIEDGALKTISDSTWRRGPGGSPAIDRQSLITFLTDRYVC